MAERVTRPGDRRDYYRIAPDMSERLVSRQIAMELCHSQEELSRLIGRS